MMNEIKSICMGELRTERESFVVTHSIKGENLVGTPEYGTFESSKGTVPPP
jgi:hypothetical protein